MTVYVVLYFMLIIFVSMYFLSKTAKDISRLRNDEKLESRAGKRSRRSDYR